MSYPYKYAKCSVLGRFMAGIKSRSKSRGWSLNFNRAELDIWVMSQGFDSLYTRWECSGFKSSLRPSIDRKDRALPYQWDNMRLVTWEENYASDRSEIIKQAKEASTKARSLAVRYDNNTFKSVKDLADIIKVYPSSLHAALRKGYKIKGKEIAYV